MESPPANMMTMAITQEKIGRSMKKLTISALQRRGAWATRAARHSTGPHASAGSNLLSALHDHAIAGLDTLANQPPIANRAGGLQHPLLDCVLAIDDERHGLTALSCA